MENSCPVTVVTTVTKKRDIPPDQVTRRPHARCDIRMTTVRDSVWGDHRKSGDNGDGGDELRSDFEKKGAA